MTTPRLGLSELLPSQSQPHVPVNTTLRRLDALVQAIALEFITELPGTQADGDSFIVADSGTIGALVGKENYLVFYYGGWNYVAPFPGMRVYNLEDHFDYFYDEESSPPGWQVYSPGGGGGGAIEMTFDNSVSASPSGTESDYNPTGWNGADNNRNRLRITPNSGGTTLNSLDASNAVDGQAVTMFNESAADNLTIPNAGTGTAANTFEGPGGGDVVILPKQGKMIQRCAGKWRFV